MAREKLKMLGLADFESRLPSELSGGQQQRVAVARSLVLEPAVLLFDEPLSNLDAKLRRRVREEIRELQQSLSLTVLYVTHDQEEALAVSDHIIVMNGGTHRAAGHAGRPVRSAREPLPRRLHRRRQPGRRRACASPATARRSAPAASRRRCARTGMAPGPATLAVRPQRLRARRRRAGRAARRVQARRVSRQPHRVRRGHRVGRAPRVRQRGAPRAPPRRRRRRRVRSRCGHRVASLTSGWQHRSGRPLRGGAQDRARRRASSRSTTSAIATGSRSR